MNDSDDSYEEYNSDEEYAPLPTSPSTLERTKRSSPKEVIGAPLPAPSYASIEDFAGRQAQRLSPDRKNGVLFTRAFSRSTVQPRNRIFGGIPPQATNVLSGTLPQVQDNPVPVEADTSIEATEHGADAGPSASPLAVISRHPSDEDREKVGGSGSAACFPSSTAIVTVVDNGDSGRSGSILDGLSGKCEEDLPISSRSLATIFEEAQMRLERLLLDLHAFDDDNEHDRPVANGDEPDTCHSTLDSSSETSDPEDACDESQSKPSPGERRQAESRGTSDTTSPGTGAGEQARDGLHRKRQRIGSDNDDHSRAIAKTKPKKTKPDKEQLLICCYRDEPDDVHQTTCPGTDKTIGDVIDTLGTFHRTFICGKCYVRLETGSGRKRHPDGVEDCVDYCLSPRCPRDSHSQRHPFTESCGTKNNRSRPEDRESILRYIFSLVHSTIATPANVFATGKAPHSGQKPRQSTRGSTRDELILRVEKELEELDKLQKRDSAQTAEIEGLRRDDETNQARILSLEVEVPRLEEKLKRVQGIVADTVRPGVLGDGH